MISKGTNMKNKHSRRKKILRSVSVTAKMCQADYDLLERAANRIWPRAVMTRSNLILGLALIAAQDIEKKPRRRAAELKTAAAAERQAGRRPSDGIA